MADRRKADDRRERRERRKSDRRRKQDDRCVVVELTTDVLRVAELHRTSGSDAHDEVSASVVPWRRDAATLHSAEGIAELTAALREVVREHSLAGAGIRLVLSGDYCIVRMARGSVEEVRAELAQLEQRSRLYLALGPGEKVLVNHVRAIDARHAHAMAAACNRATLDAIQAACDATGVEPLVIEPALVAIGRSMSRVADAPTEPCLVVHLDDDSMDVGVCHEGRLLMDYRPGGRTRVVDLPTLLESHLDRLSRHVGRFLRGDAESMRHVFLCGDDKAVTEATTHFKCRSTFEVRRLQPADIKATWTFRDDAENGASVASLGGLLASYQSAGEGDSPNLMQHILERKREPLRPLLVRSAAPLAAVLLVAFGMEIFNGRLQATLDGMQSELDGLAVAQARATELRLTLTSSQAKLEQLEALAVQLPGRIGDAPVRRVGACMPSDVWLSKLEMVDGLTVSVEGASYLEAGVYDFVRWLEQAPGFGDVALKRTQPGSSASGPITNFELELTLGEVAPIEKVARHE